MSLFQSILDFDKSRAPLKKPEGPLGLGLAGQNRLIMQNRMDGRADNWSRNGPVDIGEMGLAGQNRMIQQNRMDGRADGWAPGQPPAPVTPSVAQVEGDERNAMFAKWKAQTDGLRAGYAKGGVIGDVRKDDGGDQVPVVAREGEYFLNPETVAHIGGGDYQQGLRSLNALVEQATGKKPGPTPMPGGEQGLAAGGVPYLDETGMGRTSRVADAARAQRAAEAAAQRAYALGNAAPEGGANASANNAAAQRVIDQTNARRAAAQAAGGAPQPAPAAAQAASEPAKKGLMAGAKNALGKTAAFLGSKAVTGAGLAMYSGEAGNAADDAFFEQQRQARIAANPEKYAADQAAMAANANKDKPYGGMTQISDTVPPAAPIATPRAPAERGQTDEYSQSPERAAWLASIGAPPAPTDEAGWREQHAAADQYRNAWQERAPNGLRGATVTTPGQQGAPAGAGGNWRMQTTRSDMAQMQKLMEAGDVAGANALAAQLEQKYSGGGTAPQNGPSTTTQVGVDSDALTLYNAENFQRGTGIQAERQANGNLEFNDKGLRRTPQYLDANNQPTSDWKQTSQYRDAAMRNVASRHPDLQRLGQTQLAGLQQQGVATGDPKLDALVSQHGMENGLKIYNATKEKEGAAAKPMSLNDQAKTADILTGGEGDTLMAGSIANRSHLANRFERNGYGELADQVANKALTGDRLTQNADIAALQGALANRSAGPAIFGDALTGAGMGAAVIGGLKAAKMIPGPIGKIAGAVDKVVGSKIGMMTTVPAGATVGGLRGYDRAVEGRPKNMMWNEFEIMFNENNGRIPESALKFDRENNKVTILGDNGKPRVSFTLEDLEKQGLLADFLAGIGLGGSRSGELEGYRRTIDALDSTVPR